MEQTIIDVGEIIERSRELKAENERLKAKLEKAKVGLNKYTGAAHDKCFADIHGNCWDCYEYEKGQEARECLEGLGE